jgi:hypothetical protein
VTSFRKAIQLGLALTLLVLYCVSISHAADTLDTQKQALDIIADFADRFCKTIPLSGNADNLELSGQAKAELNELLKKIASLGIEGAAKYQKSEYQGVLRKDLASLLKDNSTCRLEVWKDLKDKLLVPASATQKKKTKDFSRTFNFEDHHCSVNEERSSKLCVDADYKFNGMVGEPSYLRVDKCGSRFVSFDADPTNKQCGIFKVRLVGCGHDSLKICKGHAYIEGAVKLLGEQL